MVKIAIVNEKDEIIRYKDRGTLNDDDIYRVSALWLTNPKGEVLIARRSYNKKNDPGKWGTAVAGTVDEGEDYYENIVKETEEEIGLTGLDFEKGPYGRNAKGKQFFYQWYIAHTDKDIEDMKIDEEEVEEVRWITKEQLIKEIEKNPEEFISSMDEWRDMFM
ncbi:MAG: hypothetical protein COV31_01745 [Candidatus Yanofskybacteria bacterium CG10_big_fil_rev_8_21_14_0_10_46_23]|uniref:Nudix hydrolase domain-containing protein n=1 Tax=Candidatus Yanofskybacteria bacterium CG10_big_fil_rev_8_21_14_0_10_46_23 TaxID=1975098 RepID=A0A2H0R4D6_9BACT|nr:MAG: hypothetical protein COV31_01745 [Candidatus Yanofskybacteria bacterium CG10_big_fil_rev_8_21_14_0_10_46_23]